MKRKNTLVRMFRNKSFAGLLILVPVVITVKALFWLFTYVDALARPLGTRLVGHEVRGAGVVTTVVIVFLTGLLFSAGPLRRLLDSLEDVFESVPIAGTLYGTLKKVISGFRGSESRGAFQRFVVARLPGRTTLGFLTGNFTLRARDGSEQLFCTVYVPTNHLYIGDVVVLDAHDVVETDLSVEDGIGCILSAGASIPGVVEENRGTSPPG